MSTDSAMTIKAIVPSLTVEDIKASIAFYEALGFVIDEKWEENGVLTSAMMRAGSQHLGINQDDWKKGRDRQKGIGFRMHIETHDNIDAIAARARAAGLTLDVEPFDTPWKTRQFELTDPTGFKLSISSVWSDK